MQREKKFTKIQQKAFLQQAYPNGHFYAETPTSFCWKYSVQPSSLSGTYQFKICYKEGKHVDVFALDKLSLCEGEKGLPHVYNMSFWLKAGMNPWKKRMKKRHPGRMPL